MPANIFDLNNAFVYYLSEIKGKKDIKDYLKVLNTADLQLTYIGTPTYTPPIEPKTLTGTPLVLASSEFENDVDAEGMQEFKKKEIHTAGLSVQVTEGITIGAATTVMTGIAFLVRGEVSLSTQVAFSSSQTFSSLDTQTFETNTRIKVPPRSRIKASLVINSLRYSGTVKGVVRVSGRIRFPGASTDSLTMVDLFRAIKNKPPEQIFSKTDDAGNTFRFTSAAAARFTVTGPPNGRVTYPVTAGVNSNFGGGQIVRVQQFSLSGQMVNQFSLAA